MAKPWEEAEDAEHKVRARIERAKLWKSKVRPTYWVILREDLIRKPLLPPEQMAEQLKHIVEVIRSTQSVLQILPDTTIGYPLMMGGEVRVMTFSDAPPVVWVEGTFNGESIDYPPLVTDHRRSYDLLRAAALPPKASLALIEEAARGYRDEAQEQA